MRNIHVHIPYERIYEHIDIIRHRALNPEIYLNALSLDSIKGRDIINLKNALTHNPAFTIHGPFMDMAPGSVDPKIREVTTRRFYQVLDVAETLRPANIVFHTGYDERRYNGQIGLWLNNSVITWRPILKKAEALGTRIAIENVFEEEPSGLKDLVEGISSPNFGICFDTGHFNAFSKVKLQDWFDAIGSYIIELHLHDNHGLDDEHLAIGDGNIDFKEIISRVIDRNPVYTIEAHSIEGVEKSITVLQTLFP